MSDTEHANWTGGRSMSNLRSLQSLPRTRVLLHDPPKSWKETTTARLRELCQLERGWDGYRAGPVSFTTANFALRMLEAVCDDEAPAPALVPGVSGDLQIEWHTSDVEIELHVLSPNQVHAWRLLRCQGDEEELVLVNDFTAIVDWLAAVSESAIVANATAA